MVNVIINTGEEKESKMQQIISFMKDLVIILVIVLVIRAFFIAPFQINGESMNDNFYDKEFILVNRFTTIDFPILGAFSPYKRGDVIVFEPRDKKANLILHGMNDKAPDDFISQTRRFIAWPKTTYIKRVVGLPGEIIRIEDGNVYIKKKGLKSFIKLTEDFLNENNNGNTRILSSKKRKDFVVPEGQYFVMGDNRTNSGDSRICFKYCENDEYTAFVKKEYIIGKVWFDMGYFNLDFHNISKNGFIQPIKGIDTHPKFLDFPKTYDYNL